MNVLLWVIVLLPFLSALILAIFGASLPKKVAGAIGCSSIGASWLLSMAAAMEFEGKGIDATLYPWIEVNGLQVLARLHLDALSLVMVCVITFVAFLIHLYSAQSMYEEDGYSRFFSYMNLFVGSMLVLVLAADLLLLYLGWEGVGLCSFLLIGFWYKERANNIAAAKAFIMTRVGDTALVIGLFMLFVHFRTLDIQSILISAPSVLTIAGGTATAIALLLLLGAVGKSAQIPLHTWLPDAMAGPSPVSALIHAATMVTAGVYLIARMNVLFSIAPVAQHAVAVIGTVTLLYAGMSALVQRDIKRVLAYSTMSQIGYMFLALGVGAWTAAIFHFVTHAFFKALLFLSAGAVVHALDEERDMFKMGGLRRQLPVAYWTTLIGAASLSALPIITAGFYSKEAIVSASWTSVLGSTWFWLAATLGTLITAGYSFRLVFLTFYGPQRTPVHKPSGALMRLAMIVLAFFSITVGFIGMPEVMGHFDPFARLMSSALPPLHVAVGRAGETTEWTLLAVAMVACLVGIGLAYLYFKRQRWATVVERSPVARALHGFLLIGWGFDWLYDRLFVLPFKAIARANRSDVIDRFYVGLGWTARMTHVALSATETGRLRDYAVGLVLGAVAVVLIVILR